MFDYRDSLEVLDKNIPLSEKLQYLHAILKQRCPFIDRIAIALYDPQTETIKTFIDSSGDDTPLQHYEARLEDAPSLQIIMQKNQPRVVNDLGIFQHGSHYHTQRISAQGYASSYTLPIYFEGDFFGFLFYNSYQASPFDIKTLHYLDVFAHLISFMIAQDLGSMKNLLASVKTARDIMHYRDDETGSHLNRMSHYVRLIALKTASRFHLSDEFIEHLFIYAPLHDIGKIGTPDRILLKPAKLSKEEFEIMKQHTRIGRNIVDSMLNNFHLSRMPWVQILRNITELHHEAVNGNGYPKGLKGEEIPVEARIVAVADVFDALTNRRPYKQAWSNDEAFAMLHHLANSKLDGLCVEALDKSRREVESIQQRFHENSKG